MLRPVEPPRPLVKVCGLTRAEDVRCCLDLGVEFTGFIFAPHSPRHVSAEQAARFPKGEALRVGVFAGQSETEVLRTLEVAGLDLAQLHGGESADFCRAIGPERVIKVLWPQRHGSLAGLEREAAGWAGACAWFLLDAGTRGGGSGTALAWKGLREFAPPRPWILAGGLGPGNVRAALENCFPAAIDCNSALESAPGHKDQRKLRELLRELKTSFNLFGDKS